MTARIEIPLAPIQGVMRTTSTKMMKHAPTTAVNRESDSALLSDGDDVRTATVGTFEDGGGNLEDVIHVFAGQDVVRRTVDNKPAIFDCDHPARIPGGKVHVVG